MRRKLTLLAFIILLLFAFPQRARADCGREYIVRFETRNGISRLIHEELYFMGDFSDRERAWIIFYNLLCMERSEFVPPGVRLLGVWIEHGELIVNVSDEIKNYGGTYNEMRLRTQIVLTGLEMRGVNAVTLLIEGEPGILPEGSTIYRVDDMVYSD